MRKHVAFLRGINVGGKNKVKMETLRELCAGLGFKKVETYINSGNVIFGADENDDRTIAEKIERAIENEFALKIKVMVRTAAEILAVTENNPFAGEFENDKELHVLFLDEELPADKRDLLVSQNNEMEKFAPIGREIFCHLKSGVADSLLGKDFIGKKLKTPATARNWRTVNKILEMIQAD